MCNRTNALLFCLGPLCFQPGSSQEKATRESNRKRAVRGGRGRGGCTPNPKRHFHGCPLLVKPTPNSGPPFSHSASHGQSGFSLNHVFSLEPQLPFPVFKQKAPRPENPIHRRSPRRAWISSRRVALHSFTTDVGRLHPVSSLPSK